MWPTCGAVSTSYAGNPRLGCDRRRLPPIRHILRRQYRWARAGTAKSLGTAGSLLLPHFFSTPTATLVAAGSKRRVTVWEVKRLLVRGLIFVNNFQISKGTPEPAAGHHVTDRNPRVQWLMFFLPPTNTPECRKGGAHGNIDLLPRVLLPAENHGRTGSKSFTGLDEAGSFITHVCECQTHDSPTGCRFGWIGAH